MLATDPTARRRCYHSRDPRRDVQSHRRSRATPHQPRIGSLGRFQDLRPATSAEQINGCRPEPSFFTPHGILNPSPLEPDIDVSALIGYPAAEKCLGYVSIVHGQQYAGPPTTIYVRAATGQEAAVQALLANTADPEEPYEAAVSQPSDVQIRTQFLAESILLAVIGGIVGVLAGATATAVYASTKHWAIVIPAQAWTGGIASAILIGAVAGLLPAIRASRMPPTVALRTV
jgi:putative ABC transport system permease protein